MHALEAISDPATYMGVDVPVVMECSILAMEFTSVSYDFCNREANMLANGLAKHCLSSRISESWESSVPDFVLQLYVNDLAII